MFISFAHDWGVVEHILRPSIVMYLGRGMEIARLAELYSRPKPPLLPRRCSLPCAIPEPWKRRDRRGFEG